MEYWKPIIGYEGLYEISSDGRIRRIRGRNCKKHRYLRPGKNEHGYNYVCLWQQGKQKPFRVGRLVGIHFIPNPYNLPEINHKYGIKSDDRVLNLEWMSISGNRKHAWDMGLNHRKTKNNNVFFIG